MRLSQRSLILASAMLATAALVSTPTFAERVHVPFAFSVGHQSLPAGDYTVQRDTTNHFVIFSSEDRRKIYNWILGPGVSDESDNSVKVMFEATDNGYELSSIQYRSKVTQRLNHKHRQTKEDSAVHVIRGL